MHAGSLKSKKRSVRVTLASWVLSKLPKCIHNSIYAQLKAWTHSFTTWRQQFGRWNMFYFWLTTVSCHDARWRKTKVFIILTRHNQLSNMTWSLKLAMKNSPLRINYNENVGKQSKILNENVDKQRQNTHVEVNFFARQKSKARSRFGLFRIIFILLKLTVRTKGTCT